MDCPSCGHPNRSAARFCAECSTPLIEPLACPRCGESNPDDAKFCDACGTALSATRQTATLAVDGRPDSPAHPPAQLASRIRASRLALEGERKQVTVLFADVTGS